MCNIKIIEDGVLKHYIPELTTNKLTLPSDVHTIAAHCFDHEVLNISYLDILDNLEIKIITIPKNLKKIERFAFSNIPSLETFVVEEGNTNFKAYDDALFTADGKEILCCPPLKSGDFTVPNGVEIICKCAFEGNYLSHVFLPSSVQVIESCAFRASPFFEEIYIPSSVTHIGSSAFWGCFDLTIFAPENSYALHYAKENNIAYECVNESVILEKANHIKEEYWITIRKKDSNHYRKKKFGYAYEWNGFTLYSDFATPNGDTEVTEKNSGILALPMSKLLNMSPDKLKQNFDRIKVIDLPIWEE